MFSSFIQEEDNKKKYVGQLNMTNIVVEKAIRQLSCLAGHRNCRRERHEWVGLDAVKQHTLKSFSIP
jgi:hypothetical protein